MSLTMSEMCAKLVSQYDVELLIELLHISADELLERFDDKIEERWDYLQEELDDDD